MGIRVFSGGGGGGAGGGASTALDNLAAVAINTSLLSDTANTDDIGSAAIPWANGYFGGAGANVAVQTAAGWGLSAPVGAWSCSGSVITRTASASDLTITNSATIVPGTQYLVSWEILTISPGTFTITLGGVTVPTTGARNYPGKYFELITAATAAGPTITASSTAVGTIVLETSIYPLSGGVQASRLLPSNEYGTTIYAYQRDPVGFSPMTASTPGGGALSAGSYRWACTFVTPHGETRGGAITASTAAALNDSGSLGAIPVGGADVIARNIYRTLVGPGATYYYVGQIANNTTTTYSDTSSDATISGNAQMPTTNTALAKAFIIGGFPTTSGDMVVESKGRVLVPNGSVTHPSISFTSDEDSTGAGIYRLGSSSVGIAANGVAAITTSGATHTFSVGALVSNTGAGTISGWCSPIGNRTSDSSEALSESMKIKTNSGAAGQVIDTLHSIVTAGASYTFTVEAAQNFRITANAGDQIRVGPYTTATAGYVGSNVVGSAMHIQSIDTTSWVVDSMIGPWSDGTATWDSGRQIYNAALASATALPQPTARVHHVTGTTTITSVTATTVPAGFVTTLIFDGVLTFTDGSNLKLAGDFVTTADDTITIAYDGTNWYEVCRSAN